MHIALVRLSAIGDVTLIVAVVRRIQMHLPAATITWIISQPAYSLVEGLSGVRFIVVNKPKSFGDYWRIYQQLKREHFDVVLAMQASLRANLLYPLINAPRKIGFSGKRARDGHRWFVNETIPYVEEHLLDGFMRFAQALGAPPAPLHWDLPISEENFQWAKQQLLPNTARWLAVNPAASKPERNWPIERYATVINAAIDQFGYHVVLTGGNSATDSILSHEISQCVKQPIVNLTGKTSLKQLAAILASVDLLIAPDTGPLHIANAIHTPVLGLYAVASSKLSGPYANTHGVIDRFDQAVAQLLHHDPNTVSLHTRVHDTKAMELITVEDVVTKLRIFNYH